MSKSKKVCVACGNVGNIPHRVNIGGVKTVVCGACLSEARKLLSFSADDPPLTAVAKFLALRNPRKEKLAIKRMQEAGVEVSWEEAMIQAKFFRTQVKTLRDKIQTEAAIKHRDWMDKLEKFLEKEVEGRGMEWEIDDWSSVGRNIYVVKIGIYPWGKTFLEGTLKEIQECVFEIVKETECRRWQCPFCGTDLGWREVTIDEKCTCGARFRQSTRRSACGSIHENNAWEEIEKRALLSLPEREREFYLTLLEVGAHVEDLFEGVAYLGNVFGWPVYAVRGKLRLRSKDEICQDPVNMLRVTLLESGFSPSVCKMFRHRVDWWEGCVDGVGITVCPFHPEHDGIAVQVEIDDIPVRRKWLDLSDEKIDELYEAWTEWLFDNGGEGEYTVTDSLLVDDYTYAEGFVWKSSDAPIRSIQELFDGFRRGLEIYKKKVERFSYEFSKDVQSI